MKETANQSNHFAEHWMLGASIVFMCNFKISPDKTFEFKSVFSSDAKICHLLSCNVFNSLEISSEKNAELCL